jgi:hypothetical protein
MAKTSKHAPGSAAASAAAAAATVVAGALGSLEVTEAERTGSGAAATATAAACAAAQPESLDFDDALASFASSEIFRMCEGGDFGHGGGDGGDPGSNLGGVADFSPELMEAVCGGVTGDCLGHLGGHREGDLHIGAGMDVDHHGGGATTGGMLKTERDGGGGGGGGCGASDVSAASGQTRDDAGFISAVQSFGGGVGGTPGAGGGGGNASMSVMDSLLSDSAFCKDFAASLPHGDTFGGFEDFIMVGRCTFGTLTPPDP